jgi:hypothetical protein
MQMPVVPGSATASQEHPQFMVAVVAVVLGAPASAAMAETAAAAPAQVQLQAPQVQQTLVAVAAAVQPLVQLVALAALVLSLCVTQTFQQFQPNLLQSQRLQDNHTHSA